MGLMNVLKIGSSGLAAQRLRMEVLSSNLSNVNTTRGVNGRPYERMTPLFRAAPNGTEFASVLDQQRKLYEVRVDKVVKDGRDPVRVYEPGHPDADDEGYVAYPNINVMEEMVGLMSASRSYEASLSAITAAKEAAKKALELAR